MTRPDRIELQSRHTKLGMLPVGHRGGASSIAWALEVLVLASNIDTLHRPDNHVVTPTIIRHQGLGEMSGM